MGLVSMAPLPAPVRATAQMEVAGAPTAFVPSPTVKAIHPALEASLVDSVVCAAAELSRLPLQEMRPILRAAFERASELGLDTEAVVRALPPERGPAK